ncbi:MAG: hypothetical protein IPM57_07300 [Oligoflexia bacterium]|nr:hypothetical protein [Oligoflexia bacterium]
MTKHLKNIIPLIMFFVTLALSLPTLAGFKYVQINGGFSIPNLDHSDRTPFNNALVYSNTNADNTTNIGVETFWQFGAHKRGLELGLSYVEFGSKLKTIVTTQTRTYYEKTPYYVANLNHKWIILDALNLGAGFYVGMPTGKTVRQGELRSPAVTNFYSETNTSDTYKTIDYGLSFKAEGVLAFDEHWYGTSSLSVLYSLENLNKVGTGTIRQYTTRINFGVGYKF